MDPVRTEIMKNRFASIVEEAATIAYRTAHTTYVKQTQDFQVSLTTIDGEFFTFPLLTGVTSGVGQTVLPMVEAVGVASLVPGDVLISNDPFATGGLCTHTMDIHLVRPVFRNGALLCYAWSFIHASDIGGAVPGSISPTLSEVFQEGIRLRPQKLYKAGALNAELLAILQDNCRIPAEVWGDLQAMLSAMQMLERRVIELCDRCGAEDFHAGIRDVMDFAAMKSRAVISRFAPGTYRFSDYLEMLEPGDMVYLQGRLTVTGDTAEIDYSGSDPQVLAALNFCTGDRTHPFLCLALTNYIQTVEPSIPRNAGMFRPIRCFAPRGTIMNAEFPAAMGNRWVAVMRVYDVLLGCLAQAVPGGLAAAGAGQAGIISCASYEPVTGRRRVSVVEPFAGGSGGRVRADGVDGTDTPIGYLKSAPIEAVEAETPLIVRHYGLVAESFGAGKYRGGAAVRFDLENRALACTITVRGLDRFHFQPWGAQGGACGSIGRALLNPGTPAEDNLGKIKVLEMKQGDILHMISPAGGGFGDPLARDAELVRNDALAGFLSVDTAARQYGVVLRNGAIDTAATAALRKTMAERRAPLPAISLGTARLAIDRQWPAGTRAALAAGIMRAPASLRPYLLAKLRQELEAAAPVVTAAAVEAALDAALGAVEAMAVAQ